MNKKIILIPLVILIISFSAGIFTEIAIPSESAAFAAELPSLRDTVFDYIKSDFLTVAAALIFAASVLLLPLVPLIVVGKVFSLGFSSAYILSSSAENALGIVMAALVPRGIFKIPAYMALVLVSAEAAVFIKNNYQNTQALKRGLPQHLIRFFLCFCVLACSSILEAFLLQAAL